MRYLEAVANPQTCRPGPLNVWFEHFNLPLVIHYALLGWAKKLKNALRGSASILIHVIILSIDRQNFAYYAPSFLRLSHHTCLTSTRGVASFSTSCRELTVLVRLVHTSHACNFQHMWKWKSARPKNNRPPPPPPSPANNPPMISIKRSKADFTVGNIYFLLPWYFGRHGLPSSGSYIQRTCV